VKKIAAAAGVEPLCQAEVILEQHTRVLRIMPVNAKLASEKEYDPGDVPDNNCMDVHLHSIGVSVIDNCRGKAVPEEILYVVLDGIKVHQGSSTHKTVLELTLGKMQVSSLGRHCHSTLSLTVIA
jgi:hypothetical protein